jgi:hypothetical protein
MLTRMIDVTNDIERIVPPFETKKIKAQPPVRSGTMTNEMSSRFDVRCDVIQIIRDLGIKFNRKKIAPLEMRRPRFNEGVWGLQYAQNQGCFSDLHLKST